MKDRGRSDWLFTVLLAGFSGYMFSGVFLGVVGFIGGYWMGITTLSAGFISMLLVALLHNHQQGV